MNRVRRVSVALVVLVLTGLALHGWSRLRRPYETASPHQQTSTLGTFFFGVSDAAFPRALAAPPDCDCTECQPQQPCGICTSYVCNFTGNTTKLCHIRICTTPCQGCGCCNQGPCTPV